MGGAGARVVVEPDGKVLDLLGLLLGDLKVRKILAEGVLFTHDVDGNDLTRRGLDLLELTEVVPEARLGDNVVGREDAHAVELRLRLRLSGELAPDDGVLGEAAHPEKLVQSERNRSGSSDSRRIQQKSNAREREVGSVEGE